MALIINALAYSFGEPVSYGVITCFALTSALVAAAFLFLACRNLGVGIGISFLFTLGHSLVLMRNENLSWFSYDAPVQFLLPFFIWSLIKYLQNSGRKYSLFLGMSAGSLVMTSAVPGIAALLVTMIVVTFQKKPQSPFRYVIPVLIPVVILALLCAKSYRSVGVANISTKGGENGLQFVQSINSWDPLQLLAFAQEAKAPKWWQWCFVKSPASGMLYGCCLDNWETPNYRPLREKLLSLSEESLARAVLADEQDQINRPWIFYILGTHECGRRVSAQYNAQSQKIWLKFLLSNPSTFFYGVVTNTNKFFNYDGPLWLINKGFGGAGFFDKMTRLVNMIMLPFLWAGIGLSYLVFTVFIVRFGKGFFPGRKDAKTKMAGERALTPISALGIGFLFNNVLFVIATCCENARMFWMAEPYLVLLAAWAVQRLLKNQDEENVKL